MNIDFYIFRHGQTEWNRLSKVQGQTDIPLNSTGRDEALSLKKFFKKNRADLVYSSDLERAYETAKISFSGSNIEIIKTKELREVYCGEVEGMQREDVLKKFKQTFWSVQPQSGEALDFSYPGGESRREVRDRLVTFIRNIVKRTSTDSTIAISTHGGALRSLLHSFLPEGMDPLPIPNCVVYKLSFKDGEFQVHGPLDQK